MGYFQKMKTSLEPVSLIPSLGGSQPQWANVGVAIHSNAAVSNNAERKTSQTMPISSLTTFTDANLSKEIHPQTLEPISVIAQQKLHPELTGPISCAHPQIDPLNGDMYNYNLEFGMRPLYRVFRTVQSTGRTEILATLSGAGVAPAFIHSFFMTKNYVILCLWPAVFAGLGAKIVWERNLLDSLAKFDPNAETKWFVIDRHSNCGHVATFTSPAFFSYHTVNAWEEETESSNAKVNIICDLIQYPNDDTLRGLYYDCLKSSGPNATSCAHIHAAKESTTLPSFTRYSLCGIPTPQPEPSTTGNTLIPPKPSLLPARNAELQLSIPSPHIGEFPTINFAYRARKSRYVYSLVNRGLSSFFDGIVKTDVHDSTDVSQSTEAHTSTDVHDATDVHHNPDAHDSKVEGSTALHESHPKHTRSEAIYWSHPNHTPSEAIFVPDPQRQEMEDGGWLLSVVLDGDAETSYLLVLDAKDMREVGRAHVGCVVGFGFHGCFVPEKGR